MAVVITTQIESIIFSTLTIWASELQQCDQTLDRRRFLALRDLSYRIEALDLDLRPLIERIAGSGSRSIFILLLRYNTATARGQVMHLAVEDFHLPVVQLLLERGFALASPSGDTSYPLRHADLLGQISSS
jgi:hypothetical protein